MSTPVVDEKETEAALYQAGNKQEEFFFVQSFTSLVDVRLDGVHNGFIAEMKMRNNWPKYFWHEDPARALPGAVIHWVKKGRILR